MDVNRVKGPVDEELLCPICSGVLQDPIATPQCEHAFCLPCITKWIERTPNCPVDRQPLQVSQLKPVPRIMKNLLARLEVTCENTDFGCEAVVKFENLKNHLKECGYNPKMPIPCERGCGLSIPKDEMEQHNCVKSLRTLVNNQDLKLSEMLTELNNWKYQLAEQRREMSILKDMLNLRNNSNSNASSTYSNVANVSAMSQIAAQTTGLNLNNPFSFNSRTVTNQIQDDEVIRWASRLQRARVARWGGMISTPDAVLQSLIERSLVESGCPEHIVAELMANAHERRWPPGLLTLETRQMNRRQYEQYVCKRIPSKQAVVVMACDNTHMSDDMILEPGLVMIFAHGIE